MPGPPYIPIPYLNTSNEPVPRFGVVQLAGPVDTATDTNVFAVKVTKPTSTDGVYAIDTGAGALASGNGAGSYGQCYIPVSHVTWVKFNGSAPATPWDSQVGPVANQWYMDSTGTGYWYAGAHASSDGWLLVNQIGGSGDKIVRFTISSDKEDIDCTAGTAIATLSCSGERVLLCDPYQDWLTGAVEFLTNRRGLAVLNVADCEVCEQPDPYEELPLYTIISMFSAGYQCN